MNLGARRARHLKIFARTHFLRLPNLTVSSLFATAKSFFHKPAGVLGRIAPLLHRGHADANYYKSPVQKLLTRYGAVVALLFFVGSFTPSSAYSDSFGAGYVDLEGSFDQYASDAPLMADQEGYLTKVNPQTNIGDRSSMSDSLMHSVISGDTISTIAAQYSLKQNTILWANNLDASSMLHINQQLIVPPVDGIYREVGKKDTVATIAKAFSVNSEDILKQNGLTADSKLAIGDQVFVPGAKPLVTSSSLVARETPARVSTTSRVNAAAVSTSAVADGAILEGTSETAIGDKPFIFPTRGKITNGYHAGHYAYDIGNRDRPAIWAAGVGTVVKAVSGCADVSYRCGGGYGNHLIVDHGNGLQTLYAHMTYPTVAVGDKVTQGEVIGKMGRSGNVRGITGIHLHFEVHKNGVKQVPNKYY